MKTMHRVGKIVLKYWLPPVVWAILIFTFSAQSVPQTTEIFWQDFVIKKMAHVIEYAILAVLFYRGFVNSGVSRRNSALLAISLSVVYGALDEFHQSYTPGRQPRVRDVIFDTIGATLGIYLLWNLLPKAPKKLKDWAGKLDLN